MTQTTHTLELRLVKTGTATYKRETISLPEYEVVLNGTAIGRVYRAMLTRERRTPGRTYVNARWYSPGWRYNSSDQRHWGSRGFEATSRRDGIERLVREASPTLTWSEVEALAATAKVAR